MGLFRKWFFLTIALFCPSAQAALDIAQEYHGVFHVAVGSRLERYDLEARAWLAPVRLPEQVSALCIDETGIYAAFGRRVARFDHGGSNETQILNASASVESIHTWGDFLYLRMPGYPYTDIQSLNKQTFASIAKLQTIYRDFAGASLSPQAHRIFGRTTGSSPGDITYLTLNADGGFGDTGESPYHGTYPNASRTHVFPDGLRVVDNSGTIYNASDLTYAGSLAGALDDIAFPAADRFVVLRQGTLVGFDQKLLPTGRASSGLAGASRLAASGTNLFVFAASALSNGVTVAVVPQGRLALEQPGKPVDAAGLAYVPDSMFLDRDQVLNLYSKINRSIFRWDTRTRGYAATIPLVGSPSQVAYSEGNNSIYLAHDSGLIERIELDGDRLQRPFANSPQKPLGLASAGEYLFVCDSASPWVTHYVYNASGTLLASKDWNYFSREYIWDPVGRRMYFFRDDTSPNDLLAEEITVDGKIGAQSETPYHGDYPIQHPLRVNDSGTKILLGTGDIYAAAGLTRVSGLANLCMDAVWLGEDIVTFRGIAGAGQLQRWSAPNYGVAATRQISGEPFRLIRLQEANGALAVAMEFGAPRFHVLTTGLELIYSSPVPPLAPSNLIATNIGSDSLTLTWLDKSDNEDGFEAQILPAGTNGWRRLARVPADSTSLMVTNLAYASFYDFRVRAFNSVAETSDAGPITVKTLPDPRIPAGAAYELTATRALATEVRLQWRDNSTNETGFKLERLDQGGWVMILTSTAGVTNHVDQGLVPSTLYTYRIRAFNDFAEAEVSPQLQVRTLSSDNLPPTTVPTSPSATAVNHRLVVVSWKDPIPNEDGFVVERADKNNSSSFVEIGRAPANDTSFADDAVEPASTYFYRVYATNSSGRSPATSVVSARTPILGGTYLGLAGRQGEVAYFAFKDPLRIERYDLAASVWLAPASLPEEPNAMAVLADGVYLGVGRKLTRFDLEGKGERFLANLDSEVRVIVGWSNFVYAGSSGGRFLSLNRATGAPVWEGTAGFYQPLPRAAVTKEGRLLARSSGVSPSDIIALDLKADGSMGQFKDSPYHGDYPGGSAVFLNPSGELVADSAGVVYKVSDLTYVGSLGGTVDDMAYFEDGRSVAVMGTNLVAFGSDLLEQGRKAMEGAPAKVFQHGMDILAFLATNKEEHGLSMFKVPLESIKPPRLDPPPALHGLSFTPNAVFADKDGVVCLFSPELRAIFRWSSRTRSELPGIPLLEGPVFAAYSPALHTIYVVHSSGRISQINLDDSLEEKPFVNLPGVPFGLQVAGQTIFAADNSGAWATHYTFAPDGLKISSKDWNYYSTEYVWSAANNRMYFFRDDTSPNDLLWEQIGDNGVLGTEFDSPYHGEISTLHPIRVSPDGRVVLLGSGEVFDAITLARAGSLPNPIADASWWGEVAHSIREIGGGTQLQRWSSSRVETAAVQFSGKPSRVLELGENLLLVTLELGQPRLRLLDHNLAPVFESAINLAPVQVELSSSTVAENSGIGTVVGSIQVQDPNPEDQHRLELLSDPSGAFEIKGTNLVVKGALDYEQTVSVTLSVRATDPYGLAKIGSVTVQVLDLNEPPTSINLSTNSVSEAAAVGASVARVTVVDPEGGSSSPSPPTLRLLDDAGGRFVLVANMLQVAAPLSHASSASHEVTIEATDAGGLSLRRAFTILVLEHADPPPTGLVTLVFEPPPTNQAPVIHLTNWIERGFELSATPPEFAVKLEGSPADPANGTHALHLIGTNQMVLRNRARQAFRLLSVDLAELASGQERRTVVIRGLRSGQPEAVMAVELDGIGDGAGPLRDFQTVWLTEDFKNLDSAIIAGAAVAVDNITTLVAETNRTFVWLRPQRVHMWETAEIGSSSSRLNSGLLSLERSGPLDAGLRCRLIMEGTAVFLRDFFISGLAVDNTVYFAPGQSSVALEIIPIPDGVGEGGETIRLSIEPGPGFSLVNASGWFHLHDSQMSAWFGSEYPQADGTAGAAVDPASDPDGNGLSNLAEFVMGVRAADRGSARLRWSATPTALGMRFDFALTRNPAAGEWSYGFEHSTNLQVWRALSPQVTIDGGDPRLERLGCAIEVEGGTPAFIRLNLVPRKP